MATGRVRSSTSLAAGQGFAPLGIVIYAPDGRSLFVPTSPVTPCSCAGTTPAGARCSKSPYALGSSIPRRSVTPDGRLTVHADRGVKALDAESLRVIRRYPVRGSANAVSPDGRTSRSRPPTGALACSTSPPEGADADRRGGGHA